MGRMRSSTAKKRDHYNIRYSDRDQTVLVETKGEDRIPMTVEQVIEACTKWSNAKSVTAELLGQIESLLCRLGQWAYERRKDIERATLSCERDSFLFLIVTRDCKYNPSLQHDLVALDWEISQEQQLSGISMSVQLLPHCGEHGHAAFSTKGRTMEYLGLNA
jgi:hypothetical protein